MIERIENFVSTTVKRNDIDVYEALSAKSIIKIIATINELVDKVNTIDCSFLQVKCNTDDFNDIAEKLKNKKIIAIPKAEASIEFVSEPRFGEWVSVEDKLPEDRHWVLVFDTGYATPKKAKYKEGFFVFDGSCENSIEITHWMPLPEPPKKEGAEK